MESEEENVQVFAVDALLKLSNLAAALAEALSEPAERSRNPLSRRYRGMDRGGGGVGKLTEENPRIQKWLEKFYQFLRNVPSTVTPRPSTVTPRSRRLREEEQYVLETQMICQEIVRGLKELYELALRYGRNRRVKVKEKWAHLARKALGEKPKRERNPLSRRVRLRE